MDFKIRVIHDGPGYESRNAIYQLREMYPEMNLSYEETEVRYNDYGHTLRELGLNTATSKYCLLTNDDNYYVPVFIEEVLENLSTTNSDIVYFDMVHSHKIQDLPNPIGYQTLITEPRINRIDIGSFVFRTSLGQSVGFNDRGFAADGIFFEAMKNLDPLISKIPKVLFVHN
jgi:hypothetical protein